MGCPCSVSDPTQYLQCAGDTVRLIAPQSVMTTYAAQAGASSSNYSMCLTMAFLAARRMEYWKVQPGDCGSPGTAVLGTTPVIEKYVQSGLQTGAAVDPEPISKGILAGVAAIFGGFTAHHAAAVATEQQTLCGVAGGFNSLMTQLESAVAGGQLSAINANSVMDSAFLTLNASLNQIKKGQNAAWGYQIAMTALKNFAEGVVFPALEALANGQAPGSVNANQFNTTGTTPAPFAYAPPPPNSNPLGLGTVGLFQGASGYTPAPMTGTNMGTGVTSASIPFSLTPGTILVIGGVAFVASEL